MTDRREVAKDDCVDLAAFPKTLADRAVSVVVLDFYCCSVTDQGSCIDPVPWNCEQ